MGIIKNIFICLLFESVSQMPAGKVKFYLIKLFLRYFSSLPKKIFVNYGDIIVQAGCWKIETVAELSQNCGGTGKVIVIEPDGEN